MAAYARESRRPGELSPREFAAAIGSHKGTVLRWARDACAGAPTRITEARRDNFGRYWIPEREIERIRPPDPDTTF